MNDGVAARTSEDVGDKLVAVWGAPQATTFRGILAGGDGPMVLVRLGSQSAACRHGLAEERMGREGQQRRKEPGS